MSTATYLLAASFLLLGQTGEAGPKAPEIVPNVVQRNPLPFAQVRPPEEPASSSSEAEAQLLLWKKRTQSFWEMPSLVLVPEADDPSTTPEAEARSADKGSLAEYVDKFQIAAKTFDFFGPAHFPLPRFGLMGEDLFGEGVVIYEGMRLLCTAEGHYEVRFTASAPDMPVTLRLQLVVLTQEGLAFSLTLPPAAIVPDEEDVWEDGRNNQHSAWQFRHVGFSPLICRYFDRLGLVTRQGTARFGRLPLP
jgi:hypothetical protein